MTTLHALIGRAAALAVTWLALGTPLGESARADEKPVQVTATHLFDGLPAISPDGKLIIVPRMKTTADKVHFAVELVTTGQSSGDELVLAETGTKQGARDPSTPDRVANLNRKLAAGRFRSLPYESATERPDLNAMITVDGVVFAISPAKDASSVAVAAMEDGKAVGKTVVAAANAEGHTTSQILGIAVVYGAAQSYAYVAVAQSHSPDTAHVFDFDEHSWQVFPLALAERRQDASSPGGISSTVNGPPPGGPSAVGKIGVAECDRYVKGYLKCLDKMDPKVADEMRRAMVDTIAAWKEAAATPDGRHALKDACRQAIKSVKDVTKDLGCQW